MTTTPEPGPDKAERALVKAMAACLRLILEDLRAQYTATQAEAKRLKRAGGAVSELYEQLSRSESYVAVKKHAKTNTDRRLRGS